MASDAHQSREDDEPWDKHDARRQRDQMAPPTEPCECFCLHCRRTFISEKIWFQKIKGGTDGMDGFWMCPTANCSGAGFTFDIFPTDPAHPANDGWFSTDDEEDGGERSWREDDDDDAEFEELDEEESAEYDPAEPQYQTLDQWSGDEDLEGEEWKHGLEPGQRPDPQKPQWLIEEEKKYDQPDERPRELDWTNKEKPDRKRQEGPYTDDDIPF